MVKFGEVCKFVEAVTIMRQNQKEYSLHKNYNNMLATKAWEKRVDTLLETLSKNIEQTKEAKRALAQRNLFEETNETR